MSETAADRIIDVHNLSKSYGDVRAVKGIDFYVERGKTFAFLGPNGAGKSTTIDMLCTHLKPDGGEAVVDGHPLGADDAQIRAAIGVVFQDGALDALLTVGENLRLRGGFYGLRGAALKRAVRDAARAADIEELMKRPYGKLSGGQRRRCDIARALIHTPKILFLDEPTTGLDPQTRQHIWQTIGALRDRAQTTIFFSTHYMEEAADADYVVVIDNGNIAARGTPADLRERYTRDKLYLVSDAPQAVEAELTRRQIAFSRAAERIVVPLEKTLDALPILELCRENISGFEVLTGTMDDAFIAITGKELRQ